MLLKWKNKKSNSFNLKIFISIFEELYQVKCMIILDLVIDVLIGEKIKK